MSDVSKTNETLIAEARDARHMGIAGYTTSELFDMVDRLADALEAATRVPVQEEPSNRENCPGSGGHAGVGTYCMVCDLLTVEPNDEREALAIAAMEAQYKFYPSMPNHSWTDISENDRKGYRAVADAMRATVPDAATEFLEAVNKLEAQKFDLRLERDAAVAALERVRAEVRSATLDLNEPIDDWNGALDYLAKKVLAALDGAPEPEWEYALERDVVLHRVGDREAIEGYHSIWGGDILHRHKAGPWLPVEGESND